MTTITTSAPRTSHQRHRIDSASRTLISPAALTRRRGKVTYWILLAIVLIVFTAILLGPLYWMVTNAMKSNVEAVSVPPTLFPKHPDLSTFRDAWVQLSMGRLLLNTIEYALGALAFQLVFDVAAAFALSKLRPMFSNVVLGLMLLTALVPSSAIIVAQYVTAIDIPLLHIDLIDTPWAIWLPTVANAVNIFLLKRFFDSIPQDLIDAASIDGASAYRTLRSIVLPMSRPILGVISIFAVTAVWKDSLWPLLVEPGEAQRTVNVGLYLFSTGLPVNVVIAGSVIAAIPTIIFFLIFQRNIMSGLTVGGIRG